MSQPRVTVTIGRSGQRSATISSGRTYSDRNGGIFENRKRSVKDRLGYGSRNLLPYQTSNKRQHLESTWKPRVFMEDAVMPSTFDNAQNPEQDLRYKLDQKNFLKSKWSMDGTSNLVNDLQERISVPPHPQGARVVVRRRHLPLKSVPVIRTVPAATSAPSQIKAVRGVSVAVQECMVFTEGTVKCFG